MWITHKLTRDPDGPNLWLRWNTSSGLVKIMEGEEGDDPDKCKEWYLNPEAVTAAAREWIEIVEAEERIARG